MSASQVYSRHSNGLEQFFSYIKGETGLNILDVSGASQANINFITTLGHRLYSEDLLQALETEFGGGDFYAGQCQQERIDRFLADTLDFPEGYFDGALVWDVLEYLAPPLLKAAADRLAQIVKRHSYTLAIFHADDRRIESVPAYAYRIADAGTLLLSVRSMRAPAQLFNNRAIEKLFHDFQSVKFFLTRDHLREVIAKR